MSPMRDGDDDDEQGKIGLLSQWTVGRLSLAIESKLRYLKWKLFQWLKRTRRPRGKTNQAKMVA